MAEETNTISSIGVTAISLGVAIIVLTVMMIVIQTIQDDITEDTTETVANETLTWAGNNTAITLGHARVVDGSFTLFNNATIVNQGAGVAANYTVALAGGAVTFLNSTTFWAGLGVTGRQNQLVTTDLNFSYSFLLATAAKNITVDGLTAQDTLASFFPLIALAMVGAIVIGIVIRFFLKPSQ